MDLASLLETLSGGADAAIIGGLYFVWRLERRLLLLEEHFKSLPCGEKKT